MDEFMNSIMDINDKIDKVVETERSKKRITNMIHPAIRSKQYLVYYLYRILCQNAKTFRKFAPSQLKELNNKLGFPKGKMVCHSLANKMTNDLESLEELFISLLEIFNMFIEKKQNLEQTKSIEDFEGFLLGKSQGWQIRNDLNELSSLIPNLGKSGIHTTNKNTI